MAKPIQLTPELLTQIAGLPAVRALLEAKARRMLPRAQRLAAQAGALEFGKALRVEQGTRPGDKADGFARPYARVTAQVTPEMDAADKGAALSRRQILRRASSA